MEDLPKWNSPEERFPALGEMLTLLGSVKRRVATIVYKKASEARVRRRAAKKKAMRGKVTDAREGAALGTESSFEWRP